jgi:pimeloyl-ACP methyl ester carboxylesterase
MFKTILAGIAASFFVAGYALAQAVVEPTGAAPDESLAEGEAIADGAAALDMFARDDFRTTPIVCPFKGAIAYKPGEIVCGLLTVPENRERPRSRKIQLHYVKLAARQPMVWDAAKTGEWKKRDDAIIYLTGGPGVTVTSYARRLKDHGARDTRDMYILEQRGVGYSGDYCPLYSFVDPAATNVHTWNEYQYARLKSIERCFAAAKARGVDLAAYNTIENARDVEALRRALGIEKWNVWGISYGSILGQAYLKEDPEGVRAAVIDAIVPLVQDAHFQKIGTFLRRNLLLLEQACEQDAVCKASFPDIDGRLEAATEALRKKPITLEAIDKELFPSGKVTLYHDIAVGLPFQMFYEQSNYGTMPAFIDAFATFVEKGDFSALRVATAAGGENAGFEISQGMYNAIVCNDGWAKSLKSSFELDQAAEPLFGGVQGSPDVAEELYRLCKKYGMPGRPAEQYAPVETDIPTIIANGEMDPITPPMLAKMILPGFKNGTYVEFPYAGHGPTRSVKCGGEFVTKFFDNPTGPVDRSCADGMKAPEFSSPLYETQGFLKIASAASARPETTLIFLLWAGLPAIVLLFGVLIYTLSPAARLINGAASLEAVGAQPLAFLTSLLGAASVLGLGFALAATMEANQFLILVGTLGFGRWFALAGLLAGLVGVVLFFATLKARARATMPIGVLLGLLLTSVSGAALGSFLAVWGFWPF